MSNGNQKSFDLVNKISKNFSIFFTNFDFATTLLFRIKQKINITFVASALNKVLYPLVIKKIKFIITQVKLITKPTQGILIKKIKIGVFAREIDKVVRDFKQKINIIAVATAQQRAVSNILIKKLKFVFVLTIATFPTLGTWDVETLLTLDTKNLGAMDVV